MNGSVPTPRIRPAPDVRPSPSARRRGPLADRVAFLIVVSLLALGALLVGLLPQFRLEAFETTGTRVLAPADLEAASGLKRGQVFLSGIGGSLLALSEFRYGAAEDRLLLAFPYLRSVEVRFRFPGRASIEAVERVEVAYLAGHDGIVLIDSDHVALALRDGDPPAGIPLVEGVDILQCRLGGPVTVDRPSALDDALLLLSAVIEADGDTRGDLRLLSLVVSVRPAAEDLIYMTLRLPGSGRVLLVRADDPRAGVAEKMRVLRYGILQGKFDDLGQGMLDLSGDTILFIPDKKQGGVP